MYINELFLSKLSGASSFPFPYSAGGGELGVEPPTKFSKTGD